MITKIATILILIAVSAIIVFGQRNNLPVFKKGQSYRSVRAKMLKAGWKPYHAPDADECLDGDERCQGRPEMENCAGTGLAPCRFLWKYRGKTIVIFTQGENAIYNGYEFVK